MESNVFKDFCFQGSLICVLIYAISFQSCFNFLILINAVSKFLREGGNEVIDLSFNFGEVRESSSGESVEEWSNKIKDLNINFIWGTCIHGVWIGEIISSIKSIDSLKVLWYLYKLTASTATLSGIAVAAACVIKLKTMVNKIYLFIK